MASELFNQAAQGADPASSDQPVVNLQVVSPSVGVNRPLLFPGLAAATTIKQLKEKIRQTLPLRPSDENQRLIYRGRALLRETDSLQDVFGADALRSPDQQTIHLVIRDASDSVSSTPAFLSGTQSPALGNQPPNLQRQTPPHAAFMGPAPPPGMTRRSVLQPTPTTAQARMPSPARSHSPAHTPEQAAAFQQQHQSMTQWLTQIQREAMARMVNQNQRGRAYMGMRGIGDNAGANQGAYGGYGSESNSGRASPAPTHTIYRETIGPNGHSYHVETVVRNAAGGPSAASAPPHGALTPTDVHGILRGADANQTPMSMANALHQSGLRRSASSASLHNRPLTQPSITTSVFANSGSRASSGRATPDLGLRSVSGTFNAASMSAPSLVTPQSRQGVEVYILSSPEGPRALVFNSAVAEAYYTPRMYLPAGHHQQLRTRTSFPSLIHTMQAQSRDDALHQTSRLDVRQPLQNYQAPAPQQQQQQPPRQQQQQQQQQDDQQPRIVPLHAGNPPVGLPNLLVQAAPHIWLIIRLALFVWFFMSPNASWSRWLTIIALAFFVFILSTGLLAGVAEQAWRPLGRHLENVFPAVDPAHVGQGGAAGRDGAPGADQNGSPNPAQMAARLVAERRGQESWLAGQLRRLERAGLLFLASIAPGVAERHIANLEAEARAQEARRREAEAAAAAAAAAAAEAAAAESNANQDGETARETDGGEKSQQDGQNSREGMERDAGVREGISAV
ncbi:hypothetical protein TsFJ059_005959 [Trichoderma semiorbis]|uniref:Ubiquitin-like domain-containing protein n=1 Tax=Trichoderma semiorbis TaxID=1491008 RepID=A0A9P8HCL1_9HYPO|nr:hypothetical protein TsFJ059_005959 [Trichoderma semiorbis]